MKKKNKRRDNRDELEKSPLDKFDNQKFADQIPLEDLNIEAEQEKHKRKSQDTSQSERVYKKDEE